jgi:hypothetical protein
MKTLPLMASLIVLSGGAALAQPQSQDVNGTNSPQIAQAPSDMPAPTQRRIAYTDQYGFHFTQDGMLVDSAGYPITAHPSP